MRRILISITLLLVVFTVRADEYKVDAIYPAHWWVGMKNKNLQLMLWGANIQENTITVSYPGVTLVKLHKPENNNYVFLDLLISSSAKPGNVKIHLKNLHHYLIR